MENGDQVIYIATASASDVEADAYRYGATDPGMFDAFRVLVAADGTPSLTSSIRGMDFGSAGDCGCANADFVQLGPNVHGWVFSSGSTQQGITTATHALVAPLGRTFVDVGNIPQYVEGDQDIEYRLTLGSENASDGWFPITVSKYRNDRRIASQVARFDRSAKRYVVRQSF